MDKQTDRPQARRYGAIALFAVGLAGLQGVSAWHDAHYVFVNTSTSLEHWAFFVDKGRRPGRGEIAFFKAPQTAIVTRHFGKDAPPFGKIVYGIAGDTISRRDTMESVNGVAVVKLKRFTKLGETLVPGPVGTIPPGCYFMATPHKDGLDSRYADIGFVCDRQIVGTGRAIL